MQKPLISIILPFFNTEHTLERAIQSILNQTYQDFELILIDNNSIDKSASIANKYSSQNSRIQLITEQKQGVVFAANSGMKAANGKYIARMDADDMAHPEKLERQFKHLESNPQISISATQVRYESNSANLADFSHFVNWSNDLITWEEIYDNRFVEFPVVNPTLMFRRTVLKDVGFLQQGSFPEDYEWFLRAIIKSHKIEKLPTPLLDWHDSLSRLTRTDTRYESDAFFALKTKYISLHLKSINQTKVWIWGAGKLGYKRSQLLLEHGIDIDGYIDIKKNKQLQNYPCVHFEKVVAQNQPFILSYITNRDRRDEVRAFLADRGYEKGINYLIVG